MKINIELDDALVEKGLGLTGFESKSELVNFALKELISYSQLPEIVSEDNEFSGKGVFSAYQKWREKYLDGVDLTDQQLKVFNGCRG